ncbi:creatininase family protein [Pseudonocardia acaciae]|uniref:creatininase family protein n=1 Tax=Pseudonocardia acaciae TaxID=551276 RepID=UPI00055C22CC|nr:creatininase family protein [Pseudonocardia acaciae]
MVENVYELGHLTREDVARIAPDALLALPVGSIEQHGPDLPLLTDSMLVDTVLRRAAARAATASALVLAPPVYYGNSQHHLFACAASVRPETLAAVLRDLISSLYESGFRRFVLVNGHGGNDETVRAVTKQVVLSLPIAVASCNYWDVAPGGASEPVPDGAHVPGHAGWWEASLALAVRPELVRTDRHTTAPLGPPALHARGEPAGLNMQRHGEWARSGGTTDPTAGASADAGERLLAERVAAVAGALRAFDEATL